MKKLQEFSAADMTYLLRSIGLVAFAVAADVLYVPGLTNIVAYQVLAAATAAAVVVPTMTLLGDENADVLIVVGEEREAADHEEES